LQERFETVGHPTSSPDTSGILKPFRAAVYSNASGHEVNHFAFY
jgi:hypothetical protein